MSVTLEYARRMLLRWMEAEEAVATGQSYTIDVGGSVRTLTRVNAAEIRERIEYWETRVAELEAGQESRRGRINIGRIIPE